MMTSTTPHPLTTEPADSSHAYRQAGVDLDAANAVVSIAKRWAQTTSSRALTEGIGGFSGGFELPEGLRRPVLLTACDGVGTKLKLAQQLDIHHTVGVDLVAMSVNDILVAGGEPLVFLDYIATGKLSLDVLDALLQGVAEGCQQAGCKLLGGETAEMPGCYPEGEYDLAGFCVGVVERERQLPRPQTLKPGQVVIGLASSGCHSNGYSLVRKLITDHAVDLSATLPQSTQTVREAIMAPTRIYIKPVLEVLQQFGEAIPALCHITGGGFYDNLPRVLPDHLALQIDANSWARPAIFPYLQTLGDLDRPTMLHTFNDGIGFVLIVDAATAPAVCEALSQHDATLAPSVIGQVIARDPEMPPVVVTGL